MYARSKSFVLAIPFIAALGPFSHAQEISYPDDFAEPMPLLEEVLGEFHFPVSTDSELAQRYFDQGMQMMYAFAKPEAARSFREAQAADPECAMCYWGEAWSWGSYLNGAMSTADAPRAYAAMNKALALIDSASDKEADLIRSLRSRYIADYKPEDRRSQDQAYADTMATLAGRYPDDLNIATLYADALFLLEERRLSPLRRPKCHSPARRFRKRLGTRHYSPRRLSSLCTCDGVNPDTGVSCTLRRIFGQLHSRRESH